MISDLFLALARHQFNEMATGHRGFWPSPNAPNPAPSRRRGAVGRHNVNGLPVGVASVSRDSSLPSRSTNDAPRMFVFLFSAACSRPIRSRMPSAGPRTSIACPPAVVPFHHGHRIALVFKPIRCRQAGDACSGNQSRLHRIPPIFFAFVKMSSSIAGVSLPVKVFCWLGW